MDKNLLLNCIDACHRCADACHQCATECLHETDIEKLSQCIHLDWQCAAICEASAKVLSIRGRLADQLCNICVEICLQCAEECEKHDQMMHCRVCAEMCRACATSCMTLVNRAYVHS